MPEIFRYERRVEFCETDAAGIAHFSAYFQYMEQAEHALWRHLGLSVHYVDEGRAMGWPRVSAQCDFSGSARFEDVLDVAVAVTRIGERSVTFAFSFSHQGVDIGRGLMTSVCCQLNSDEMPASIPIPEKITERLRPFLHANDPFPPKRHP